MQKHLFFDDNKLFSKVNAVRGYGRPELIGEYVDSAVSTDFCTGWVFLLDDGRYRLMYFGHGTDFSGHKLFSAISSDGITFSPEALFEVGDEKQFSHEVMDIGNSEIAFIYEDKHASSSDERYKLLMSGCMPRRLKVMDEVYTSPDLISWKKLEGVSWADGAEPLASIFYNEHENTHTLIERPFWGIRTVGYKETRDFKNYTEFRHCLNVDSVDEDLCEIYGMYAFEYDGNYIGLPHIYRGFESSLSAKFSGGIIDTQLAYSTDGRYWRRALREPFISGVNGMLDKTYPLVWVNGMMRDGKDIILYASASEHEHGPAFRNPGTGKILILRLREDGFISLRSKDASCESVVATREKIWHGGDLHVNIKARKATLAVYTTSTLDLGCNLLGISEPLKGFSHGECVEFCGDSTDWVPEYKSGRTLDELVGKTLVFEIKFEDGEIFSLKGNYTDVFNVEGAVYRTYGALRL